MELNPTWFVGGMVLGMITSMLLFDKLMDLFEKMERKHKAKKGRQ